MKFILFLQQSAEESGQHDGRAGRQKKPVKKRSTSKDAGVFVRRNVASSNSAGSRHFKIVN